MADPSVVILPIENYVIETAAGLVLIYGGWLIRKALVYLHLKSTDVLGQRLLDALDRAVAIGKQAAQGEAAKHSTVPVGSIVARVAADYILGQFPEIIKKLGMSEEQVLNLARAHLAAVDAQATAPAMSGTIVTKPPSPTDASTKPAWGTAAGYAGP